MTGFLRELKRRHVFRVAVVYGVVAWLLVQIAHTTFPYLGLPTWAVTLIIVGAALGFPLALIVVWAFELTPDGVKRTGPLEITAVSEVETDRRGEPGGAVTQRRRALVFLGTGGLLVLAGLAAVAMYIASGDESARAADTVPDGPRTASIAVLPFVNLSGDAATDPFVSGLHHDLLGQLSKIAGLEKVTPRTSVMGYAEMGKRVPEIAAELDVAVVLEAGVQRVGDRVRINVLLVDGRTERQLWSESYERELTVDGLFAIQADIARRIAHALAAELTPAEERGIRSLPTESLDAYDLYLRAIVHGERWADTHELLTAIALVERAVELDAEFAGAWAKMSSWRNFLAWSRDMAEQAPLAHEALERARALAPDHVETLNASAEYRYRLREYEEALSYLDQVDLLQPGRTYGLRAMITRRLGRWEEAAALMERQIAVDPRNYESHYALAGFHHWMRRFDEARRTADRAIAIAPERSAAHRVRLGIALSAGDTVEARHLVETLPPGLDAVTRNRLQALLAYYTRDFAGALSAWPRQEADDYLGLAVVALRGADPQMARAFADSARTRASDVLRRAESVGGPGSINPRSRGHRDLALAYAMLGDERAAREHASAAEALVPVTADWTFGVEIQRAGADMLVLLGDQDGAVERLEYLLTIHSDLARGLLRLSPLYDPLREHPAFRRLIEEG